MSDKKEEITLIRVISVDRKKHTADPSNDVCSCGVKILRKKELPTDVTLFSCYECTY